MIIHHAQVDSQTNTNHDTGQAYGLRDIVCFRTLEEPQQNGSEWEDDGKRCEHDCCVCWADLVAVACGFPISARVSHSCKRVAGRHRGVIAIGDSSLRHVHPEVSVRHVALDAGSLRRA